MSRRGVLVLVMAGLALVPALAPGQTKTPVTLLLNFYASAEHVPFAYGVARGIYAEEGLDLTVKEGAGSGATVNAVIGDSARFGFADAGALARAVSKDAPLKMLGSYVQSSPFSIIFFGDKGYRSIKDLVGKKVSFTAGDALHQAWPTLLRRSGVERAQVQEVLLAPAAKQTAVLTGAVDAMAGYYTTQAGALEREAKRKVSYLRYADFGVNPLALGLFVHTKYLGERDLNCRMVRATGRAVLAAVREPDAAVDALHERFAQANKGARDLTRQQWTAIQELLHTPASKGKSPGYVVKSDWEGLLKLLAEYGGMEKVRPAEDYFTNEFNDCR